MTRAFRSLTTAGLVVLAASACGGHGGTVGDGSQALDAPSPVGSWGPAGPYTTPGAPGTAPAVLLPDPSTQDDMKTFVYAFNDAANLAAETAALTKTAQSLWASIIARDYDSAESFGGGMLSQANALQGTATAAGDRLRPLGPADGALVQARGDGLVTFDLAAGYASAATDLAEAALALDAAEAASVIREASSLLGAADRLASSFIALTTELESWASANPSAAARAISLYA
jgi:hypothetical protein